MVFFVVEDLRLSHVVGGVDRRLDFEDLLRVAQMRAQIGRHFTERLQNAGEDARPGLNQRVTFVGDVEPHVAVIGVHDGFDRIANVIDAAHRL